MNWASSGIDSAWLFFALSGTVWLHFYSLNSSSCPECDNKSVTRIIPHGKFFVENFEQSAYQVFNLLCVAQWSFVRTVFAVVWQRRISSFVKSRFQFPDRRDNWLNICRFCRLTSFLANSHEFFVGIIKPLLDAQTYIYFDLQIKASQTEGPDFFKSFFCSENFLFWFSVHSSAQDFSITGFKLWKIFLPKKCVLS